jgi:type II secretory pathway pseudopilin PulG
MVTWRSGHSLPELLVALAFLGATLAGLASASLLGARWGRDAVLVQQAVARAGAVLDSLLLSTHEPVPGSDEANPSWGATEWTILPLGPASARIQVTVTPPAAAAPVRLEGLWIAPPLEGPP